MLNLLLNILIIFFELILLILPVLLSIAYLTLLERKVMAAMQRRKGPNIIGFFGLLQPLADGLKLFLKETILPSISNKIIFFFAPLISFFLSLLLWIFIPFNDNLILVDMPLGFLYNLAFSSLSIYGIIIAGWSSNSKYAFLGALRSAAQMISYEISLSFILLSLLIVVNSLNLIEIVEMQYNIWFIFPFFPLFLLFFISLLAETNRPPFDLPEAEAELVAGYNVEYSSMTFALFFLGEYSNIILMSIILVIFFFGGWYPFLFLNWLPIIGPLWLAFKVLFLLFLFIWVRASLPRYRYDQLMRLGWKVFLPIGFGILLFLIGLFFVFEIF
jgi:NADH-quinone oxidoreductase subunit H